MATGDEADLRARGLITIRAAQLELSIFLIYRDFLGLSDDIARIVAGRLSAAPMVDTVRSVAATVGASLGDEEQAVIGIVAEWAVEVKEALRLRNRVVHGVVAELPDGPLWVVSSKGGVTDADPALVPDALAALERALARTERVLALADDVHTFMWERARIPSRPAEPLTPIDTDL